MPGESALLYSTLGAWIFLQRAASPWFKSYSLIFQVRFFLKE